MKDFLKVTLLTIISAAAFIGFFHIAMQYPLAGIYGTVFFAIYPKIKSACQKKKGGKAP